MQVGGGSASAFPARGRACAWAHGSGDRVAGDDTGIGAEGRGLDEAMGAGAAGHAQAEMEFPEHDCAIYRSAGLVARMVESLRVPQAAIRTSG